MTSLVVDATYENGVLRLDRPLPLGEHEWVRITVQSGLSLAEQTAGLMGWKGPTELAIHESLIDTAVGISQQTGLLSNDALIIAVMHANGLTNIASNETDFDSVTGITRYGPV